MRALRTQRRGVMLGTLRDVQARGLRMLQRQPNSAVALQSRGHSIIALVSGKGGNGEGFVSCSLRRRVHVIPART